MQQVLQLVYLFPFVQPKNVVCMIIHVTLTRLNISNPQTNAGNHQIVLRAPWIVIPAAIVCMSNVFEVQGQPWGLMYIADVVAGVFVHTWLSRRSSAYMKHT